MKKNVFLLILAVVFLVGVLQTNGFAIRVFKEQRSSPSRRTNVVLNNKNDVLQLIKYINDYYAIRGRARYGRSLPETGEKLDEYQNEGDRDLSPIDDNDYPFYFSSNHLNY